MKKKLALLMSIIITMSTTAFVYAQDKLDIVCELSKSTVKVGDTFYADFKVTDNEKGYNTITTYMHYDPNVIQAVKCGVSDIPSDLIIKRDSSNAARSLFAWNYTNGRLTFVPQTGDPDYEGYADSVKTAAEIGIIKLTNYFDYAVNNLLQNYEGTGTLVRMKFVAVGNGSTAITLDNSDAAYFDNGTAYKIQVNCEGGYVSVKGDVNGDGKVTSYDATQVLLCASNLKELTEEQKKNADINSDGKITSYDATRILLMASDLT